MNSVRRIGWTLVVGFAIAATGPGALAAKLPGSGVLPATQIAAANRAEVDKLIAEAVDDGFAGQVLAVVDGELVLHEGYGFAHDDGNVPIDTSTVFAIGSVTKAFTRAAILKLAEEGQLSLSDPLSRYFDGVPDDKQDITIDELLTMRAGLHEYHDDTGDHQAMTRDEALARILRQQLRFEPGAEEAYSNSGYTLLAAIIENVGGTSYPEYVRENLIEPAGMENAGFHGEDRWPDAQVARGRGGRVYGDNAPHHWPSPTWVLTGAGGMVANAEDLLHWIRAVRAGDVLGPEAMARFYPPGEPNRAYAGGDDFGFITMVMEIDHADDIVIINTNTGFRVMDLAGQVIETLRGEPLPFATQRRDEGDTDREVDEGGIPDSPRGRKAMALLEALEDGSEAALQALVAEHYAPALRDTFTMSDHMELLGSLSGEIRQASDIGVAPIGEFSLQLRVVGSGGEVSVFVIELSEKPPHGITGIALQ